MCRGDKSGRLLPLTRMAREVGVPSTWLREKAEAGEIPALRAGSRLLFRAELVKEVVYDLAGRSECEPAPSQASCENPSLPVGQRHPSDAGGRDRD